MKVRFGEIPEEGLRLEIKDESWFPDNELQRRGPVHAIIMLKPKGQDRVLLTGELRTTLEFACDRCLETYVKDLDNNFSLDLEYAPGTGREQAEHEISAAEMEMIYLQEPVIDIFEILNQQIFLMLPEKHLCRESCRGLCPRCGANLNEATCSCKQELRSSPFAVLKKE
ncbi:MAG: YceD family protein [Desulfobulbales bacterium]